MNQHNDLIDTTEMYLRTVLELEEDGLVPLRVRIAERLGQSVPTASQTVARMQRDGLLAVSGDRRVELTPTGRSAAIQVMRKHRLAECMLVDVIGLDWQLAHEEACRWEHVMSDAVERRMLDILGHPTQSPYGNPIPGLTELGEDPGKEEPCGPRDGYRTDMIPLAEVPQETRSVIPRRIGEPIQSDTALLGRLCRAGFRLNAAVPVSRVSGKVRIGTGRQAAELEHAAAALVFLTVSG